MHPLLQRAKGALATVDGIDRGRRDGEGILAAATTVAAIRYTVDGILSGINGRGISTWEQGNSPQRHGAARALCRAPSRNN